MYAAAKSSADVVESAPLSGAGLYVAANWDSRNISLGDEEAESELMQRWIDLPPQEQNPWKSKALSNQRKFALAMAKRPQQRQKKKQRRKEP